MQMDPLAVTYQDCCPSLICFRVCLQKKILRVSVRGSKSRMKTGEKVAKYLRIQRDAQNRQDSISRAEHSAVQPNRAVKNTLTSDTVTGVQMHLQRELPVLLSIWYERRVSCAGMLSHWSAKASLWAVKLHFDSY